MISVPILALPLAACAAIALLSTHITIASVTIFLHRHQSHRSLTLHPLASHLFRFWLWLTTGIVTREWVAIHRKHHAKCETAEDPHSPRYKGVARVLFTGVELYRAEARNQETLARYGNGTPDDWIERHLYSAHPSAGILLLAAIELILFGLPGIVIFAVQMIWIPLWAAGVINGLGHHLGYRNFETEDASTNLLPWGILVGGEELHNNHHAFPASAKLSSKPWEFDIGWMYIRLLALLKLAVVKRVSPNAESTATDHTIDTETVRALLSQRFYVMKRYARRVIKPVMREARSISDADDRRKLRRARRLITREGLFVDDADLAARNAVLEQHHTLATVFHFKQELKSIWARDVHAAASRLERLRNWCVACEQTGIDDLVAFAAFVRGYRLN